MPWLDKHYSYKRCNYLSLTKNYKGSSCDELPLYICQYFLYAGTNSGNCLGL